MSMGCLAPWIACIPLGKIVQSDGRHQSKAGKKLAGQPWWCLKHCQIIIYGSGWHASFGYARSLNDVNILNLSPLLESLVCG